MTFYWTSHLVQEIWSRWGRGALEKCSPMNKAVEGVGYRGQRVHAYDGDASDIKSSPSSSPHVHHCGEISGAKYYLAEVVDAFSPGTKLDVHRPQGTSSAKATGKTAAVRAALPRSLHLHDHQHTMIDVRESLPQRPSLLPLNGTASGAKQPLVDEMKSALQEHHIPML
ncbi:hypothetical protein OBBRIDRAFT_833941 [Obba rivulosa]|uniref:Uncharacterized protein n=1 Tax=Obba rivulosa TaxID=1052685 RepID=A0A8E2B4W6_9APHY|nr:hypothetical protein OBBRIDRAFT_833941 [Obba rivulosa]